MKKGVTEIVAVVLLVAIAVIAAVSLYFWMSGVATKQPVPETPTPIVANPLPGGKVLIANLGQRSINASSLRVSDPNVGLDCSPEIIGPGEQTLCTVTGNTSSSTIAIYGEGTGSAIVQTASLGEETSNTGGTGGSTGGGGTGTEKPWYYSGWNYRMQINITNSGETDLTDYQVKIGLNGTNFNFSHANQDGSDIRFTWLNTTSGNEEAIPYWIEYWNSTEKKTIVWVKVPTIPAGGNTTVYIYYGNSSAASQSNGDAVFEFFDDFDGTSLNASKWVISQSSGGSSISVSNSMVNLSVWNTAAYQRWAAITSLINFSYPMRIISKVKHHYMVANWGRVQTSNTQSPTYGNTGEISGRHFSNGEVNDVYMRCGDTSSTYAGLDHANDVDYHVEIVFTKSETYSNNDYGTSYSVSGTVSDAEDYLAIGVFKYSGYTSDITELYVDWIAVSKYTSPEPTTSLGPEETRT